MMQSLLGALSRHTLRLGRVARQQRWTPTSFEQSRPITTTCALAKVHKKGHEPQQRPNVFYETDSELLRPSVMEMKRLEATFREELDKRLSFRTDLRLYEDFYVDFPDGTRHRLANIGQLTQKGTMISINFSKNPSYASHARLSLQKFLPELNIQQEGPYLHIKTPPVTRESRKEKIAGVKKSLLNDYKKALDKVYDTCSKRFEAIKDKDEKLRSVEFVLHNKHAMQARAESLVKEREEKLLAEIV